MYHHDFGVQRILCSHVKSLFLCRVRWFIWNVGDFVKLLQNRETFIRLGISWSRFWLKFDSIRKFEQTSIKLNQDSTKNGSKYVFSILILILAQTYKVQYNFRSNFMPILDDQVFLYQVIFAFYVFFIRPFSSQLLFHSFSRPNFRPCFLTVTFSFDQSPILAISDNFSRRWNHHYSMKPFTVCLKIICHFSNLF